MRKLICRALIILISVFVLMYAEYRFIMLNLCPYTGENGTVYIEIFDRVDEYYADPVFEIK